MLKLGEEFKEFLKEELEENEVILWEGNWTDGDITLSDNIYNYKYCLVTFSGVGTLAVVPIRPGGLYFRGAGSYCTTSALVHYAINANITNATTLSFVAAQSSRHTSSNAVGNWTVLTPTRIIGVK